MLLLIVSLFCWFEVSQGPPAAFQPILNSIPFQKQNGLRRCVVNIAQNNPVRLGNAPLCTVGREWKELLKAPPEVRFVSAVTANGSVKFLPAV